MENVKNTSEPIIDTKDVTIEHDIISTMGIKVDPVALNNTVEKIKQLDLESVKTVGSDVQQKISTAVTSITQRCKTLDCGEAGKSLIDLNAATSVDLDLDLNSSFIERKLFGAKRQYTKFVARYQKASANLDTVVHRVDKNKNQLESSFVDLSQLVTVSKQSFHDLQFYVEAFKKCTAEQDAVCKLLTPDSMEYLEQQQKLQVYRRRLETLQATRVVLYQTVKESMILMVTNRALIDDMQYTVDNIVPLWEAQIITATNAELQKRAVQVNKAVKESFNKMLVENAKRISENAIDIMNGSHDSIIQPETLEKVGSTLDGLTTKLRENFNKTTEQYNASIARLDKLIDANANNRLN